MREVKNIHFTSKKLNCFKIVSFGVGRSYVRWKKNRTVGVEGNGGEKLSKCTILYVQIVANHIYIVTYYIEWVTTSWTYSIYACEDTDFICPISIDLVLRNLAQYLDVAVSLLPVHSGPIPLILKKC